MESFVRNGSEEALKVLVVDEEVCCALVVTEEALNLCKELLHVAMLEGSGKRHGHKLMQQEGRGREQLSGEAAGE